MSARIKRYGKIFALAVLMLVVLVLIGLSVTQVGGQVDQQKVEADVDICLIEREIKTVSELLEAGKLAEAEAVIDEVKADYDGEAALAESLGRIVSAYEDVDMDRAKSLAGYIVESYPESASAQQMQLKLDVWAINALIDAGQTDAAQVAVKQFVEDDAADDALPNQLYRLAEQYGRQGDWSAAIALCDQAAADATDPLWIAKVRLQAQQYDVYALMEAGDDEGADEAIGQMQTDFAGEPDLVERLDEIASEYLYSGHHAKAASMLAEYHMAYPGDPQQAHVLMNLATAAIYLKDEAAVRSSINQLMAACPDDGRTIASSLVCVTHHYRLLGDYEKERRLVREVCSQWTESEPMFWKPWAQMYSQITAGPIDELDGQIEALMAMCPDDKRACRFIYWLGNACHRMGYIEQACGLYQQAIERWPMDGWTLSCRLAGILLDPALDEAARQPSLDAFVNDFYGHRWYAVAAYRTACDVYRNAEQKQHEGLHVQAKADFERALQAIAIVEGEAFDRAGLSTKQELTALKAYGMTQLGRDEEAIAVCDRFLADWPNGETNANVQMTKALCYQRLPEPNEIGEEELQARHTEIVTAFRAVWEDAADPLTRAKAARHLGRFYVETNQWELAAQWLEAFLATGEQWGHVRYNAALALQQAYLALGRLELAEDVSKEFFQRPKVSEEKILGSNARLAVLAGA